LAPGVLEVYSQTVPMPCTELSTGPL